MCAHVGDCMWAIACVDVRTRAWSSEVMLVGGAKSRDYDDDNEGNGCGGGGGDGGRGWQFLS